MAPQMGSQPGASFGVNPFWDNNPAKASGTAPPTYSHTQTQVSYASSTQLQQQQQQFQQQQQRFSAPQMYPQQYPQYQYPQANFNGMMMGQMGSVPGPNGKRSCR